jgi:hypothetical protein
MTLLDLLTIMIFVEPIATANGAAELSSAGIMGHIVATALGTFVGFVCAWGVRKGGYALASRSRQSQRTEEELGSLTTFFVVTRTGIVIVLLMSLSGFLGFWVAHPLMRFLR